MTIMTSRELGGIVVLEIADMCGCDALRELRKEYSLQ